MQSDGEHGERSKRLVESVRRNDAWHDGGERGDGVVGLRSRRRGAGMEASAGWDQESAERQKLTLFRG